MKNYLYWFAEKLYGHCYPAYYPLYATWKAYSDRQERALLRKLIEPGMNIVDVGANIGLYTRFLARLAGDAGHVDAFEPAPLNYSRLQKNVGALKNVSIVHAAVGAQQGTVKLYISNELNVDHHTYDSADGRRSIDVPLIRLDDYFAPGQRVDWIKIDVQGYEYDVLIGAKRVLAENPNVKIIMEYWPYGLMKAKTDPRALIALILSLGLDIRETFHPFERDFDLASIDSSQAGEYCNLLIARPLTTPE
jgi:FkbM family methyltransferase